MRKELTQDAILSALPVLPANQVWKIENGIIKYKNMSLRLCLYEILDETSYLSKQIDYEYSSLNLKTLVRKANKMIKRFNKTNKVIINLNNRKEFITQLQGFYYKPNESNELTQKALSNGR